MWLTARAMTSPPPLLLLLTPAACAAGSWARPNQSLPSFGSVTLPDAQGAYYAGPCCTSSGAMVYGSPIILVTDLQVHCLGWPL